MRLWLLTVPIAILASCNPAPREEAPSKEVLTYVEILKQSLEADTLQPCFYRMPDGEPDSVIVADEVLSSRARNTDIQKFGHPVAFVTKEAADSANLPAYFWVVDYQQFGDDARIQLEDPVRHILFGAAYSRTSTGWQLESVQLEPDDCGDAN